MMIVHYDDTSKGYGLHMSENARVGRKTLNKQTIN